MKENMSQGEKLLERVLKRNKNNQGVTIEIIGKPGMGMTSYMLKLMEKTKK